jgi:hypothetical protein
MNKIPVGQTVAFAYRFVFTRFTTVVAIAGLPAVLASTADYLVRSYSSAEDTEAAAGTNLLIWLAGTVTAIFISSVATVGISRAALGLPLDRSAYTFPVGLLELRMFAAKLRFWVGVGVLVLLASLVTSLAFMLGGVPLDQAAGVEPSTALLVASLIAWVSFGYAIMTIVRMGFLLPATVVCENAGGLQRSHDLARGNFWRMAAVLLAIAAPIFVAMFLATYILVRISLGPELAQILQDADVDQLMRRGEEAVLQNIVLWEIFNTAIFILASGLLYSASAFAYRSLTANAARTPGQPWRDAP